MRLVDILLRLKDLDEAAEVIPEENWVAVADELADKVDDIKTVVDRLEREAERLTVEADKIAAAATAVLKNRKRLLSYVAWSMEQTESQKIPGNRWRMDLQNNAAKLEVEREAGELDMLDPALMPFVRVKTATVYSWEKEKIKEALQNSASGFKLPGMKLTQGKKVAFYVRKSS